MSYARWGEATLGGPSGVYVYPTMSTIECANCGHASTQTAPAQRAADMLTHVKKHEAEGLVVPPRCVERLERETRA